MNKKHWCFFKRFAALVAALVLSFSLSVPAFASNNWPASPSNDDFHSRPGSWYVWQRKSLSGYSGYELICSPMKEYSSYPGSSYNSWLPYSTDSSTYSYTSSSGTTHTYMYSVPYVPTSDFGYLFDLPSFPVGDPSYNIGALRVYPVKWRGDLQNISDVFSDRSIFGFLTSWPSSDSSSISDYFDHEIFDYNPIYVPTNIFFFGDKSDSSTNHTSFSIRNGDNDFWASPSNDNYLHLSMSHLSTPSYRPFPLAFSIPSSDVGLVFCKQPSSSGMHVYNTQFDVSISFALTLWVPDALLPADVKVGDWISQVTMDKLQDQLVKDFDVDSDTLTNTKDNLNSWNSSSSVDTDVASTSISVLNAMFQNLGGFLFIISLMVFGAVVLRMLIRKAVDG